MRRGCAGSYADATEVRGFAVVDLSVPRGVGAPIWSHNRPHLFYSNRRTYLVPQLHLREAKAVTGPSPVMHLPATPRLIAALTRVMQPCPLDPQCHLFALAGASCITVTLHFLCITGCHGAAH